MTTMVAVSNNMHHAAAYNHNLGAQVLSEASWQRVKFHVPMCRHSLG